MQPSEGRQRIYEFGEFRLKVGQLMLYRNDAEIPLRPKAVETLIALVERQGEIVTKDELMETIWSDVIVEESNLSRYIHMLRSALGVMPNGELYIETYRRRGFRFNPKVNIQETSATSFPPPYSPSLSPTDRNGMQSTVVALADWRRGVGQAGYGHSPITAPRIADQPHNLPTPLTELIGRRNEVMELEALLLRASVRLVTLTGPGGTGKTRLGNQVATDLLGKFPDGVFLVQLASVSEAARVPFAIARTLRVDESGAPALDDLKSFLRERHTLIVLDNFEQLLDASPLVAELLEACSHVKVLATSRAALHIRGEYEYPVSPLSLPSGDSFLVNEALQYAAVRLFVERAAQANSRFRITDDNALTIVEICQRLDGLPLAIELAAVRIKTLQPEKILDRLANRLQLLCGGARDLPARQQTMRDAIVWSYDLLNEREKSLFRRLAVFAGDFTVEAAEYVDRVSDITPRRRSMKRISSVAPGSTSLPTEVLDGIASLSDKSLLVAHEKPDGETRFKMLEVVRELALESLEASCEADLVRRRHAEYYRALGERAERHLQTSNAGFWVSCLEREHANLRSAIHWLFGHDPVKGAHLASAISVYMFVHSHISEGREWLEAALERNTALPDSVRLKLRNNVGMFALAGRDYDSARAAFQENVSERKISGETSHIADSLRGLGSVASSQLDYPTAKKYFDEALMICRQMNHELGIAQSLLGLGAIALNQHDLENAQTRLEESLLTYRKIGYMSGICACLVNLGEFACASSHYELARSFFTEAITIAVGEGYRDRLSLCLNAFAVLAVEDKEWKIAAKLTGVADRVRQTIGFRLEPQDDDFHRSYIELAINHLGSASFSAAYKEGGAMKIEDAIALVSGNSSLEKIRSL